MLRHVILSAVVGLALGGAAPTAPALTAPAVALDPPPGRYNDTQPHFGGAKLENFFCTSGFSVRKNGSRTTGSVVAGHCFREVGEDVLSGTEDYGRVVVTHLDTLRDMALVTGIPRFPQTYAPSIWVDPGLPAARRVIAARDPQPVDDLCVSGAKTGNRCGLIFDPGSKQTVCSTEPPPEICTDNLAVAWKPGTEKVAQPGDSGAPVYVVDPDTGGVTIVGMLVGGSTEKPEIYFEPISFIEQQLDVTVLVTSP